MRLKFFIVFIAVVGFSSVFGQDTLRFLNGKTLLVDIGMVAENEISFLLHGQKRKSLIKREKSLIFSYTKKGSQENIIYQYKPEYGNIYKVEEMRGYMVGERHAEQYYKARFYSYLAFATGALAGYAVTDDRGVAIVSPIVFSSLIIIPGARVKQNELNRSLLKNDSYRAGYKRVAKGKKFMKSLKYGALGMAASILFFQVTDN